MFNFLKSIFKKNLVPKYPKYSRILFILKKHEIYGGCGYSDKATGLRYSAQFINDMLNENGFTSKQVIVTDNNDIDREVHNFKPDIVFIEALWVVPEKFDVLKKLHPDVTWVVRVHSEIPFLANEGIAIEWLNEYLNRDILIAPNSEVAFEDFETIGLSSVHLPNFYPSDGVPQPRRELYGDINIGCFGAIRPLKNNLNQAIAAIQLADDNDLYLNFHINSSRVESGGEGTLKNLRALFNGHCKHQLIEHSWKSHEEFLQLLDQMDLHSSVSFSETFSIVTADAVTRGVPVVTSYEVPWADDRIKANPTDAVDIANKMARAINRKRYMRKSLSRLKKFSEKSKQIWIDFLSEEL